MSQRHALGRGTVMVHDATALMGGAPLRRRHAHVRCTMYDVCLQRSTVTYAHADQQKSLAPLIVVLFWKRVRLRHPWKLSAFATAIATWLGALSHSRVSRRAHRGVHMPVRCYKKHKEGGKSTSCSAGCNTSPLPGAAGYMPIALLDSTTHTQHFCRILAPGLIITRNRDTHRGSECTVARGQ